MNKKRNDIVSQNVVDYLKVKLILPLIKFNADSHYDERCYRLFTAELATVFSEYQPDYFETNYHSQINKYYYSSLCGEYIPEEELTEIIIADDDDRFDGLQVYFEDFKDIGYQMEECLENYEFRLYDLPDLMIMFMLKELNNSIKK